MLSLVLVVRVRVLGAGNKAEYSLVEWRSGLTLELINHQHWVLEFNHRCNYMHVPYMLRKNTSDMLQEKSRQVT